MRRLIAVSAVLLVASAALAAQGGWTVQWTPISAVPGIHNPYVGDLYISGRYGIAIVHDRYLWLSEDHGVTWSQEIDLRDPGGLNLPPAKHVYAVARRGERIYIGGNGFMATSPDGVTWTYRTPTFANVQTWVILDIATPKVASSNAYAVGYFIREGDPANARKPFTLRTTDNGNTWERWGVPPTPPGSSGSTTAMSVSVARDGTVVVSGSNALLAERPEGPGSWTDLGAPKQWGSLAGTARRIACVTTGGGTANHIIWAGRWDGKVMIKRGNNPWEIFTVKPGFTIRDIAFRTANEGAVYGYEGTLSNFAIYHTNDGGEHWYREPISPDVKGTDFNLEASASKQTHFVADGVRPVPPNNYTRSWLLHRIVELHLPDKLREPLYRIPYPPVPGPGPIERIPGRIERRVPRTR